MAEARTGVLASSRPNCDQFWKKNILKLCLWICLHRQSHIKLRDTRASWPSQVMTPPVLCASICLLVPTVRTQCRVVVGAIEGCLPKARLKPCKCWLCETQNPCSSEPHRPTWSLTNNNQSNQTQYHRLMTTITDEQRVSILNVRPIVQKGTTLLFVLMNHVCIVGLNDGNDATWILNRYSHDSHKLVNLAE